MNYQKMRRRRREQQNQKIRRQNAITKIAFIVGGGAMGIGIGMYLVSLIGG